MPGEKGFWIMLFLLNNTTRYNRAAARGVGFCEERTESRGGCMNRSDRFRPPRLSPVFIYENFNDCIGTQPPLLGRIRRGNVFQYLCIKNG